MTDFQERRVMRTDNYARSRNAVSWPAIFAGALAGFAVTIIMTTLGAAIGITVAGSADTGTDANPLAVGGAALGWWALTVLVAGFVAGMVVSRTAPRFEGHSPFIHGTLAWVTGVIVFLVLLAIGAGSMLGGLGGGLGAAVAQQGAPSGTPADSARVLQQAATAGAGAAWGLLVSQLLGLGSTILGASMRGKQHAERRASVRAA